MCSWASDAARARVLTALVGEGNEEAAQVLAEETTPEFAADLIEGLRDDVARVRERDQAKGDPWPE